MVHLFGYLLEHPLVDQDVIKPFIDDLISFLKEGLEPNHHFLVIKIIANYSRNYTVQAFVTYLSKPYPHDMEEYIIEQVRNYQGLGKYPHVSSRYPMTHFNTNICTCTRYIEKQDHKVYWNIVMKPLLVFLKPCDQSNIVFSNISRVLGKKQLVFDPYYCFKIWHKTCDNPGLPERCLTRFMVNYDVDLTTDEYKRILNNHDAIVHCHKTSIYKKGEEDYSLLTQVRYPIERIDMVDNSMAIKK